MWPLCLSLLPLLAVQPPKSALGAPLPYQQPQDCPMQRSLRVRIDGAGAEAGRMVTLKLIESSIDFLHSSERTAGDSFVGSRGRQLEPLPLPPCFYQGNVEDEEGLAVAKQRNGWISGHFHYGGRAFEIPEQFAESAEAAPLSARPVPPPNVERRCGLNTTKAAAADILVDAETVRRHQELFYQRSRRSLKLDTHSKFDEPLRKYVRLILIGDQAFYAKQGNNVTKAKDRLWDLGNYVNALYKQLGVNVITVHTDVFVTDPYTLAGRESHGVKLPELLEQFMAYRMVNLGSKPHSAAHLISNVNTIGPLGIAYDDGLCSFLFGGGVIRDTGENVYSTAVTLAHELGHNLGLQHDGNECTCPDKQGCIMREKAPDVNWSPVRFTECSVARFLDFSVPNGLGYCMSDPPPDSAVVGEKATCGNRIVEAGEDCDCGPPSWCNNDCCDPQTCKFRSGAKCASGECCNRATCSVMSQGTVCRASRGTCDLPEYCNGSSEWCPQFDDYKVDGTECLSGKAYCYKGRCSDRDSRCAAIFDGADVTAIPADWFVNDRECYCKYRFIQIVQGKAEFSFSTCTEANQRCGVLFCVGPSLSKKSLRWKGKAGVKFFNASVGDGQIENRIGYMWFNLDHSGYRDPGMVPNGAECGANKMCVDSVCVSTSSSVTCPSCSGRGDCAQSGLCFCQPGYRPPDCSLAGGGGSLTNRLPDDSITTASDPLTDGSLTNRLPDDSITTASDPDTSKKSANPGVTSANWWPLSGALLQLLLVGC